MPGQRRRRWPNIKPALVAHMFAGLSLEGLPMIWVYFLRGPGGSWAAEHELMSQIHDTNPRTQHWFSQAAFVKR